MRKPKQRVVVAGVDLTEKFGLCLTGESTFGPPSTKTYTVDVPGGDGVLDLTEALCGDVVYGNRSMSLTFLVASSGDFEKVKTEVAGFLHGRKLDFSLSFDPGYTYTGRFSVNEWHSSARHGVIVVDVDAEPYKLLEHRRVRVAAGGGAEAVLGCGRKRQCPVIECARPCVVCTEDAQATLQPGRWRASGLWLTQGSNALWVDSTLGAGDVLISEHAAESVSSRAAQRAGSLFWKTKPADTEDAAVYFEYDVKEL